MSQLVPDEVLLGLLAERGGYGYQLLEHFRRPELLGNVWYMSTSQLYAVLKRLVQKRLIVGREVTVADAPARTEYQLTDAGRQQFEAWLAEADPSPSVRKVRVEFLSRLYLARLLNRPTISIVRAQKKSCHHRLGELMASREQSAPGIGLLAIELVIAQLHAILDWIDRCELIPLDEQGDE